MQLRDYQESWINQIRGQYQLGHKAVLGVLPTGGGKTVCFCYVVNAASKKGNRAIILVHRNELINQTSNALKAMSIPHGRIEARRQINLSYPVQVASVQTLARRLHHVPPEFAQLLVVDEAHHSNAGTWAKVIKHFDRAKLLGVTATPIRGDGRGLGEWYEQMVIGPSSSELTESGYLAKSKVYSPPGFDAKGIHKKMGDFDIKEAEFRVGMIMGDIVGHYEKYLKGQTAIAFCCSVAHAEAVARLFQSAGIPAASIDGTMSNEQRADLLTALGHGRIKILTSCALIGEGVDVPTVGGCILLRPTESVSLHLQMIGRCLRPSGNKTAVILDHVGNTLRLGHHLENREWTLQGIKKSDKDQAPSVKICPECYATSYSLARSCQECGYEFEATSDRELKEVDGELVEMTLAAKAAKAQQARARTLEDLIELGRDRGYKNPVFWAKHVMNARTSKGRY